MCFMYNFWSNTQKFDFDYIIKILLNLQLKLTKMLVQIFENIKPTRYKIIFYQYFTYKNLN